MKVEMVADGHSEGRGLTGVREELSKLVNQNEAVWSFGADVVAN
jgi:hypothetical protein